MEEQLLEVTLTRIFILKKALISWSQDTMFMENIEKFETRIADNKPFLVQNSAWKLSNSLEYGKFEPLHSVIVKIQASRNVTDKN